MLTYPSVYNIIQSINAGSSASTYLGVLSTGLNTFKLIDVVLLFVPVIRLRMRTALSFDISVGPNSD